MDTKKLKTAATVLYYDSHCPEFTVEVPEKVQVETTTEVKEILLLEVRGILQKCTEKKNSNSLHLYNKTAHVMFMLQYFTHNSLTKLLKEVL